jgi:hypothetical protein
MLGLEYHPGLSNTPSIGTMVTLGFPAPKTAV